MAEDYMRNVAAAGGVCADRKSFPRDKGGYTNKTDEALGIRVDVNIFAGEAFVP
jgi:hypothetical protein